MIESSAPATLIATVEKTVGQLHLSASLRVDRELLTIIGPNGSGKTSLLLSLLGYWRPDRGRIELGNQVLFDSDVHVNRPLEQRGFAYVPQNQGLFPHLSALANVEFALACRRPAMRRAERRRHAFVFLERMGVAALAHRQPSSLSGGERQRVALARAFATQPKALLCDEPFSALSPDARAEVRSRLVESARMLAVPTLLVTHDRADVVAAAGRVAVMEIGRIVACASLDELSARPPTPYIAHFVGRG
jgi:ABC-type spermidine/putrescine transport systems, ATPase components